MNPIVIAPEAALLDVVVVVLLVSPALLLLPPEHAVASSPTARIVAARGFLDLIDWFPFRDEDVLIREAYVRSTHTLL
jgi:hypothetical protein